MKEKVKFDNKVIEEIVDELYPITNPTHIVDEIINEVLLNGKQSKQKVLTILNKYMLDVIKSSDSIRKKTKEELEKTNLNNV